MEDLIGFAVRHGQTDLNKNRCFRSWIDAPLDEKGLQQAQQVAEYLSQYTIARMFSSPLRRAMITAQIIARGTEVPVEQHGSLLPWHLGVFAGLPKDENKQALDLFVANPSIPLPNGESLEDFEERCFQFFDSALQEASPDNLIVFVSHTSNVTALGNFVEGNRIGEPEQGETVAPGGVLGIYQTEDGYRVEPAFGEVKTAEFGGS